jgi:metacaspase-1
MVAQLVVEDKLRAELRARLRTILQGKSGDQPFDVIAAHSLGTLITYDFFRHDEAAADALRNGFYITFGSQINNDFARSRLFPGTLSVPATVRAWYHLYNDCDPVLTAPIRLSDPRFRQVSTHSEAQHSPVATPAGPGYLDHPNTERVVWPAVALSARPTVGQIRGIAEGISTFPVKKLAIKPHRRALLIGINEYPDPANRLEGCVNDVFLMSELLQERGFEADDIRFVLNERATADAIRERLAWLLYRADDGMERVLFYSGHGAQMPGYNAYEEVDHLNECLVPYDFAWTEETAITDKDIYRLYSDLPAGARFFAVFDCCYSGGLTRDGSRKARAIDPPDDSRHRMLRWNPKEQMWRTRAFPPLNPDFGGSQSDQNAYMGSNLATYKIGRAMRLRRYTNEKAYQALRKNARACWPLFTSAA